MYFMVDGDLVARCPEHTSVDPATQGITTINLYLTAGQFVQVQVQVQNRISTAVYGTGGNGYLRSWFTGFLLHAD